MCFPLRDLKPDNLLFTKDKYIKLCDFGSCYPGCVGKKKVKVSIGTPRYWAPEVNAGLCVCEHDVYVCDCVCVCVFVYGSLYV